MADLAAVAAAITSYVPDDTDTVARVQDVLLSAASAVPTDTTYCESLLTCVLDSMLQAGSAGKELLDHLLLEVLPPLADFAALSQPCSQSVMQLCELAAAACTPRDTITAFLEVISQLLAVDSMSPHVLQFLCGLLSLLPQQLSKLSRRKAAFAMECLVPAAAVAKVHGQVLQSWMLAQLKLAATSRVSQAGQSGGQTGPSAGDGVLRRLDTFLAASWQVYEDFVAGILHQVLSQEPDAVAAASCRKAVVNLILCLLLHLTAAWPPQPLLNLALQTVSSAVSTDSHLPTAASVQPPTALFSRQQGSKHAAVAADTGKAPAPAADGRCESAAGGESNDASDAAGVVAAMLQLLHECGVTSWQVLADTAGSEAAGAALAVVYDCCLGSGDIQPPSNVVERLQLACSWCAALASESDGNALVMSKCIALLQLAAAAAAQVPPTEQPQHGSTPAVASAADKAAAQQLLPRLEPCTSLLASTIASAVGTSLQSQATVALQQLLRAPGQGVCYCCLQLLLNSDGSSSSRVHPEVAALLMQEVRQQLARSATGPGLFNSSASVRLILPWLQQHSPVGWQNTEQLADNANAICAALAIARLALLKSHKQSSSNADEVSQMAVDLKEPLMALSKSVADALALLQLVNKAEHAGFDTAAASSSSSNGQQQQQQRVRIPGDAEGAGQAVDAWLALSRVQDVLDRVMELL